MAVILGWYFPWLLHPLIRLDLDWHGASDNSSIDALRNRIYGASIRLLPSQVAGNTIINLLLLPIFCNRAVKVIERWARRYRVFAPSLFIPPRWVIWHGMNRHRGEMCRMPRYSLAWCWCWCWSWRCVLSIDRDISRASWLTMGTFGCFSTHIR
jgi:hypothetical protein